VSGGLAGWVRRGGREEGGGKVRRKRKEEGEEERRGEKGEGRKGRQASDDWLHVCLDTSLVAVAAQIWTPRGASIAV